MTRAVIYCRISRDRIGAGLGVERQEADCRALATKLGFLVVLVLVDNDLSAYSGKPRPGYKQLLDMITSGEIQAVLTWHGDRLHRSLSELEHYIAACEQHEVPTFTATAGELDLTTATGRMHARIAGAVARHEVEHSIERQQAAKLQAAAAGKWGGGRRPFGFEADGVTLRPAEAAVIAEVAEAVLLGASLLSQARTLNERGVTTSTGKPWEASDLGKMLRRARNAGLREHRKAIIGPAGWPAVIEEQKWRALASMLTDPSRRTSPSNSRRWLLSSLARCGDCAAFLRVTKPGAGQHVVPSYTCSVGKHVVRHATELDAYVSAVAVERLSRPDAVDLLKPTSAVVDVAALWAEAAVIRQRLDDLADNLDIDERTLARRSQKLKQRQSEVQEEMTLAGRGNVLSGVVDAPDVAEAWKGLHLDRRRAVIDTLMSVVVLRTRKGRRPGWKAGESYFDPTSVTITPKM